jgi:hypothetical protein
MAEKVVPQPAWTNKSEWTFKSEKPVLDATGGKHDEFHLREPTYGEIEDAESAGTINGIKQNMKVVAYLISKTSGKDEVVVRNLPFRLFSDMATYISHFM